MSNSFKVENLKEQHLQEQQTRLFTKLVDGKKRFQHEGTYNKYLIPGNDSIAIKHQQAWRIGIPKLLKEGELYELCPCCQQAIEKISLNLLDDDLKMSFLGSGYPLYMNFIRYCLMIIGILYLTSGQFNLVSNSLSSGCDNFTIQVEQRFGVKADQSDSHHLSILRLNFTQQNLIIMKQVENYCMSDWIAKTSLANKRFQTQFAEFSDVFNLSSVLLILLIIFLYRKSQLDLNNQCDILENTPSDYTIMVTNIPFIDNPEVVLKEFFESINIDGDSDEINQIQVCKVNCVYKMDHLDELISESQNLVEQKKKALDNIQKNTDEYLICSKEQDLKIQENHHEIRKRSEEIHCDKTKFAGVAFISLKKESQKKFILEQASHHTKQIVFNILFGCLYQEVKTIEFRDVRIKVQEAPEPSDIIWKNIVHNDKERLIKRIVGLVISTITTILFLLICLWCAKVQAVDEESTAKQTVNVQIPTGIVQVKLPQQSDGVHWGALVAALTTVFINSFLVDNLCRLLVHFESYETYSLYVVSLATKLSLMLFFNSAIIAFLVSTYYTENIYGAGGLIYTEVYFFVSNAIVPPIINFIDPDRVLQKLKLWYLKKKGTYTQSELNILSMHPVHQIELKYADIMKTLYLTFFYAPLIPIGYPISFFGVFFYYWVEKV